MTSKSPSTDSETLEPPYSHQVSAARGWLELGNIEEAESELEDLPRTILQHPEVLMIRWEVASQLRNWHEALLFATVLTKAAPDCPDSWIKRSYALHELKRTKEAWDSLFNVSVQFEQSPTVAYNLACYACQLNRFEDAQVWLRNAVKNGKKASIKKMALEDQDLTPMREFVQSM